MPAKNPDLHGNAPDESDVALLPIDVINDLEFDEGDRLLGAEALLVPPLGDQEAADLALEVGAAFVVGAPPALDPVDDGPAVVGRQGEQVGAQRDRGDLGQGPLALADGPGQHGRHAHVALHLGGEGRVGGGHRDGRDQRRGRGEVLHTGR